VSRRERMLEGLAEEIRAHIEIETQGNIDRGMPPEEARAAALRKFGNVTLVLEDTRGVWSRLWLDELLQDLRYGLRMLEKGPGFTAVAVLTLALGIGANTAIFSLLNAVLLQAIPVQDPAELVVLRWSARERPQLVGHSSFGDCERTNWSRSFASSCSFSYPMFQEIRDHTAVFRGVAAFAGPAQLTLGGNGAASMVNGEVVSGDFFETVGVAPAAGRTLGPADEKPGAEAVAVLSYSYWQSAFGGAPEAVGRSIALNGVPFTIVGVASARFARLTPGKTQDLWLPLSAAAALRLPWSDSADKGKVWWLAIVGRLRPEFSRSQAEEATTLAFRNSVVHDSLLKAGDDPKLALLPAQQGLVGMRAQVRRPLFILMAAVGILLLISCSNVAGLLLSRAASRQREFAVRLALGAGRGRITRQLLTESMMLAVLAASVGVLLAWWGARALAAFVAANRDTSFYVRANLDLTVLLFTVGVSALTGILFGLAPAFRGARVDLAPVLKENALAATGSGRRRRFPRGSGLVVGQVALSVIVLAGAGLVVRSLANLKGIDPGFDTRNVLQFGLDPTLTGVYKENQLRPLYRELARRLAALPGLQSVTYSSDTLLDGGLWTSDIKVEGSTETSAVETQMLAVGPDFFSTMRIPLVSGRALDGADAESEHPVAVVNQAFARRFLENRAALGLHFAADDPRAPHYQIVGVVADTKYEDLRPAMEPTAFIPLKQGAAHFALRTAGEPLAVVSAVRRVVSELDSNLPVFDVRTQKQRIERLLFNERLLARLASLFGLLALLLASIGLYGLLAYEVAQRTREIGIRVALGAQRRDVRRLVGVQGLVLLGVGGAAGILAALGLGGSLASFLYGVRPADPVTLFGVFALLLAVGLLASWIPARRAARVDPMVALRCE
jgi:predicted permease